jgi:hypothetical protein
MYFKSKGEYDIKNYLENLCQELDYRKPQQWSFVDNNGYFATRLEPIFIDRFKKDHPDHYGHFIGLFLLVVLN